MSSPAFRLILDRVTIGTFVALLMVPSTMLLLGHRSNPDPNREAVAAPSVPDLARLDLDAFAVLTDYADEQNPLRSTAAALNARVDLTVFHDSPSSQVELGSGDWMFLATAARQPCIDQDRAHAAIQGLRRTAEVIEASGRRAALAIAPDKVAIATGFLGSAAARIRCSSENARRMSSEITPDDDSILDLYAVMSSPQRDVTSDYFRQDSHWNRHGSAAYVEALIRALNPRLAELAEIEEDGDRPKSMDLAALVGLPQRELDPNIEFVVPGTRVDVVRDDGVQIATTSASDAAPLIEGDTWFLHDSFGIAPRQQLPPFFSALTTQRVGWSPVGLDLPEGLENADTVIALIVQRRAISMLVSNKVAPLFAARFASDLETIDRAGSDAAITADFVEVTTEAPSGEVLRLTDDGGSTIGVTESRDGVVVYDIGGLGGELSLQDESGSPVEASAWRYITLP